MSKLPLMRSLFIVNPTLARITRRIYASGRIVECDKLVDISKKEVEFVNGIFLDHFEKNPEYLLHLDRVETYIMSTRNTCNKLYGKTLWYDKWWKLTKVVSHC